MTNVRQTPGERSERHFYFGSGLCATIVEMYPPMRGRWIDIKIDTSVDNEEALRFSAWLMDAVKYLRSSEDQYLAKCKEISDQGKAP